jgi:hypothetical protein
MKDGKVFRAWLDDIKGFIEANGSAEGFTKEMKNLRRDMNVWRR